MTAIVDASERKAKPRVALHYDDRRMKLSGWAAPESADHAANEVVLSLMAGDIMLGTLRRDVARPDVDGHIGYAGPPCGFSVPDFGLAAFARATRLCDLAITIRGHDLRSARRAVPGIDSGEVDFDPLGSSGITLHGVKLADLWLESARHLSLRFEGTEQAVMSLAAYQCTPDGVPILVHLGDDQAVGGLSAIATVKLLNPMLPLLLIYKGVDGSIDGIDVIPFPSLARGGMHEAERLILGDGSDNLADTAALSATLLRALFARSERTAGVATVALDPAIQTGLEPVLNNDVLGWIGDFLGISIDSSQHDGGEVSGFVADLLARHSPDANRAGHRLHLPADCIPTISGLISEYPEGFGAQTVIGGMAVVEWNRHGHIWSVWQPPLGDWLEGLQGAEARLLAPALEYRPKADAESDERALALAWPLALALRERAPRVGDDSPFEIAAEVALPLMSNRAQPTALGVSALILCDRADQSVLPLLESLSRQQSVGLIDVIVSRPTAKPDPELSDALEALFPDRHRMVALPAHLGRLDRIKAVCSTFVQQQVMVVDAATILPDPRTLATLLAMLEAPGVATVGCMVRAAHGKPVAMSAGYTPVGMNFRAVPALSFGPIDPTAFRQPATYAVAANSLGALVTTKDLLCEIKAQGSTMLRPDVDDVLLGLQVIERGGHNLCTTLVSVYAAVRPATATDLALSVPYRLSIDVLGRIMASTTLVQTIR